jgi:hypothetical protein
MRITRREYNGVTYSDIQVSRFDSKGKIMDICDSSSVKRTGTEIDIFEKVVINMTSYGEGKQSVGVKYFMDLDDFIYVAYEIMNSANIAYKDFKGNPNAKYPSGYESRCLTIMSWAEGMQGKGAYTLEITNGEGVPGELGQVLPRKGATLSSVKVIMSLPEAKRVFNYAYLYFGSVIFELRNKALKEASDIKKP